MISLKDMMIYLIITTITVVNGQSYRAGVVLYQPIESPEYTPDEQLTKNVDNVIKLMKDFRDQVDIFVLPEYALTNINAENASQLDLISSSINIGKVNDMKCTNDPNLKLDIQVKLACAAKNSAYIVANLIEEDVVLKEFFLTNVAFDREGKICLKCRKQHIINGTHLSPAPDRLPCNFTASIQNQNVLFAVLFGTDLVYALPEASKVNHAIVTSATKNNLPLNYSINMNQAFAIFNGINLIAAEYNNIELNYGGSGIFYSNGSSAIAFNSFNTPNSNLNLGGVLISEVPIKPSPTPIVNVEYTIYGPTPKMNMEYINLPALNFTGLKNRHCIIDKRCCSFEASLSADSISPYRWVVLQSKTTILEQEMNIFFCGIVAPSANFTAMTFKNISISVDDKLSEIVLDLPATLDEKFLPTKYQFNKDARSIMLNEESKIMLFGIMEILGPDKPNTGASTALIVIIVLLILVLVGLLIAFLIWRKRQAKNRRNF